ncbi:sigma 54-interacting transcriptional regulator [Terrilactibacillus sp. S3-3]|nr:sigma 54-interacting transcriptional regulator [Terrilactibacillus sp. S3-3]
MSLEKRRKENHVFLQVARPIIEKLVSFFDELNVIFLLTDADGYVLFQEGNKDGLADAEAIRFIEGVKWTEEQVGTNAIGTTLRTGEPMTIIGSEHYAVASQSWSCSAAPIRSPDGRLLGILDASLPGCDQSFRQYILPMIVTTSYVIEEQLGRRQAEDERELLRYAASLRTSPSAGQLFLLIDGTIKWLSPHFRSKISDWEGQKIQSCLDPKDSIQKKLPIVSSQDGRLAGYVLELKTDMFAAAKKSLKEPDTFHFNGVKGVSKTFDHAVAMMKKAASSDVPVHIHGETGTGKELAAKAIYRNSPRSNHPFIAVNCGAIPKELMESELFGYAPGAFTGAKRGGHKGVWRASEQRHTFS